MWPRVVLMWVPPGRFVGVQWKKWSREGQMNKRINAALTGAVVGIAGVANAEAQSAAALRDKFFGGGDAGTGDIASAGNGGVATSSANGGAVSIGDVNSGGNACNAIGVG